MTSLIDSHCHIDFPVFDTDRDAVLQRSRKAGVNTIVVPGTHAAAWEHQARICKQHPELLPAYGLHPLFLPEHKADDITALEDILTSRQPCAVGECGLDFYDRSLDRERQEFFFEAQLGLAEKYRLPVIIHARKATTRAMEIINNFPGVCGVFHSYSGSFEQAKVLIDKGFYFGFGGPVTWEGSRKLHRVAAQIPAEHILLETDAPDQPDALHRGQRNEPAFLLDIARSIASLRGVTPDELAETTASNARRLFHLN